MGFIPRDGNEIFAQLIDAGYSNIFDMRVQRITPETQIEKQVGVVTFLKDADTTRSRQVGRWHKNTKGGPKVAFSISSRRKLIKNYFCPAHAHGLFQR